MPDEPAPMRIKLGLKTYQYGAYDLWYLVGEDGEVSSVGRPDYALIADLAVRPSESNFGRLLEIKLRDPAIRASYEAAQTRNVWNVLARKVSEVRKGRPLAEDEEPYELDYEIVQAIAETAALKPNVGAVTQEILDSGLTADADDDLYVAEQVAHRILTLFDGRTEAEIKAEAFRTFAQDRYLRYLEHPEIDWTDQPSEMARRYARAADDLLTEANRIEKED